MFPGATYRDQSLGPDQLRMVGRFDAAGTAALANVKGKGFTVARTGVGTYVVSLGSTTYPTPMKSLIGFMNGVKAAANVFTRLTILTDSSTSYTVPTITLVNTDTSGAAADVTATFFFEFVFGMSELNS